MNTPVTEASVFSLKHCFLADYRNKSHSQLSKTFKGGNLVLLSNI